MKKNISLKLLSPLAAALFVLPSIPLAQITGKVTDENGEPLPYATVYVRNTSNGTATNADGEYKLTVPKGEYEIVFQYIGYKQTIKKVAVGTSPVRLDIQMEPSNLELGEVVVSSVDPAVRIMRQVIAKRKYYRRKVTNYSCDAYIKGFYKLVETPKKILGQEVGDMGGILDTAGQGIIYLSESVSKLWAQDPPGRKKEVMMSSKVSGNDKGFSLNRATMTDFNLYKEKIEIEREILSPLADNAFDYYRFKHAGRFKNELGFRIEKIKVIPKRPADPTFSGFLYIVDDLWLLSGVDLTLTGTAIKQPVLDTLRIRQQFVPLKAADEWGLLTQVTSFRFGILGFKIEVFFNGVFSNYDLDPTFEKGLFGKETFKVEDNANTQPLNYWAETRPIPLTEEEHTDYVKKDSLRQIWESKAYLDSLDRKHNKFKIKNLLLGYTWENSYRHTSVSYPAVLKWAQFNTVQGWLLDLRPKWEKLTDKRGATHWKAEGDLNYGFSEKKLRSTLRLQRQFESVWYKTFAIEGGTTTAQFNNREPINTQWNSTYSLWGKQNFMKIYDKAFARAEWSQVVVPSLSIRATGEWALRKPLANNSNFSWTKKSKREYSPNEPVPHVLAGEDTDAFPAPQIWSVGAQITWNPGRTYSSYPQYRNYHDSHWPAFTLSYQKAIPLANNRNWADFDMLHLAIQQEALSWGLAGYTEWRANGGYFLRNKRLAFIDFYHPNGNQTFIGEPKKYINSFLLLPYYAYSTTKPFAEAHVQHHLQGWILDKIPLLRKLNWKEVVGIGVYYAEQTPLDPAFSGKMPYWEINLGFENIGYKAIRPLRVDLAGAYFSDQKYRYGVILGVGL